MIVALKLHLLLKHFIKMMNFLPLQLLRILLLMIQLKVWLSLRPHLYSTSYYGIINIYSCIDSSKELIVEGL